MHLICKSGLVSLKSFSKGKLVRAIMLNKPSSADNSCMHICWFLFLVFYYLCSLNSLHVYTCSLWFWMLTYTFVNNVCIQSRVFTCGSNYMRVNLVVHICEILRLIYLHKWDLEIQKPNYEHIYLFIWSNVLDLTKIFKNYIIITLDLLYSTFKKCKS